MQIRLYMTNLHGALLGMIDRSALLALDSKIRNLEANLAAQAKTTANTLEVTGLKDRIGGFDQALKEFKARVDGLEQRRPVSQRHLPMPAGVRPRPAAPRDPDHGLALQGEQRLPHCSAIRARGQVRGAGELRVALAVEAADLERGDAG